MDVIEVEHMVEASIRTLTGRFFTFIRAHVFHHELIPRHPPSTAILLHILLPTFYGQSNVLGNTLICHLTHQSYLCVARTDRAATRFAYLSKTDWKQRETASPDPEQSYLSAWSWMATSCSLDISVTVQLIKCVTRSMLKIEN